MAKKTDSSETFVEACIVVCTLSLIGLVIYLAHLSSEPSSKSADRQYVSKVGDCYNALNGPSKVTKSRIDAQYGTIFGVSRAYTDDFGNHIIDELNSIYLRDQKRIGCALYEQALRDSKLNWLWENRKQGSNK